MLPQHTTDQLSEASRAMPRPSSDNSSAGRRPFGTVLVANRGEIACRIIATLRRLGIRSVAVHSDADAGARHVSLADVAVRIGPAPATESYLSVPAIIDAARATGADAVHPGYGFLSENPELARACADAGIVFVGPSVAALEAMADKITAKEIVAARGVPVVPGSTGRDPVTGRALDDEAAFREDIRSRYEEQGDPYYATARLWDDGIVDPLDTRDLLGLALDVVSRTPLPEPRFGVFRM